MENALYQLKTCGKPLDGMSYIITCDNGSVLVIDGSYDAYDADHLLRWLQRITGEEKPTVDAWFLTHAHPDHTYAVKGMGERHADEITVKRMVYSFPDDKAFSAIDPRVLPEIRFVKNAIANFKGCETVTPVRGDVYSYGSIRIEVLMTHEDLFRAKPEGKITVNDTSTVLRLEVDGQKILFPGDIQDAADRVIIDLYGDDLKSDAVQMAHHGCGHGSTFEFYQRVDPSILIWPSNEKNFALFTAGIWVNRRIFAELNVKDVIPAAHGSRRIPLPISIGPAPFLPELPPYERELIPEIELSYTEKAPALSEFADPVWDSAEKLSFPWVCDEKGEARAEGEVQALWDEKHLYLRLSVRKSPAYSDPDAIGSADCENLRVYFTEEAVSNTVILWKQLTGEGFVNDLKIYPETKNALGANNNHPDFCTAVCAFTDEGWNAVVQIAWKSPKKKGDLIGWNLELSAYDEPKKLRGAMYSLRKLLHPSESGQYPGTLMIAALK